MRVAVKPLAEFTERLPFQLLFGVDAGVDSLHLTNEPGLESIPGFFLPAGWPYRWSPVRRVDPCAGAHRRKFRLIGRNLRGRRRLMRGCVLPVGIPCDPGSADRAAATRVGLTVMAGRLTDVPRGARCSSRHHYRSGA